MNTEYKVNIPGLFGSLGLGEPIDEPEPLSGGHLHRMYKVATERGSYAVKVLNPQVTARPDALKNFADSERIARIASKYLPALPANMYGDSALQRLDGQFYLIFDYKNGEALKPERITPAHCAEIGRLLAVLHGIDFSALGLVDDYSCVEHSVDWCEYLRLGREAGAVWADRFGTALDMIYRIEERFLAAADKLSRGTVLTHGDLDPKNVLWPDGSPVIIDWEAAGFAHPALDLVQNALYWAREGDIYSEDKIAEFFGAYRAAGGRTAGSDGLWEAAVDKSTPLLGWLEYSLRRSLGLETADEAEARMGADHVFYCISTFEQNERFRPRLLELIGELCN